MMKVSSVDQCAAHAQCDGRNNDMQKYAANNYLPMSIAMTILERNWRHIFAGVVAIDIAYVDKNLVVFDMNLLARVRGTRICARKEPDFF